MKIAIACCAIFASLAAPSSAAEATLGALMASGHSVSQMSVAEIFDDKAHLLILVEGESGGFLCKVEALLERDKISPMLVEGRFPDIIGLKTSDAVKWRTCAKIY